ncbi:MAG: cyanophycinase [Gaiellales bacterium]
MRSLVLSAVLLALVAPAHAGSLVLVGGALQDERIVQEIVRRAGGPGAKIGILTASSKPESQDRARGTKDASNSRVNGAAYVALFAKYGAKAEWIPIDLDHVEHNRDPALVAKVAGLGGVFFGGGDQSRYLTSLRGADGKDSPVLAAIRHGYEHGDMVLAGTSAGTAAMTEGPMITGGTSGRAFSKAVPSVLHGLGFFPHGLLDTHFGQRQRQARIVRLASDRGEKLAFGVDEDTALVVDDPFGKNPRMQVLGKNGVSIFRLDRARARQGKAWQISNVKFAYLGDGDRYHLGTNRVLIDRAKALVDGPGHAKLAGPHATIVGRPSYYKATRDGQLQRSMRGATLSFRR